MTSTVTPELGDGGNHNTEIHLFVHASIYLFIHPSTCSSIHLSTHSLTCLSACPSTVIQLSHQTIYLSTAWLPLSYPFIHILPHFNCFFYIFINISETQLGFTKPSTGILCNLSDPIPGTGNSHFIDVEAKAQREAMTSPRSSS